MKRLLVLLLFSLPLAAADFEAGMRHVVVKPMARTGDLDVALSRGFAATAEVFWTERVSTQVAVTFINPEAILEPAGSEPVDLGTLGMDAYSISARYHFARHGALSAFVGAGAALVSVGNLDDQFGDEVDVEFGEETGWLIEGGVRYRVLSRLFLDATLSYTQLRAEGEGRGARVPLALDLDPASFSVGAAWRF